MANFKKEESIVPRIVSEVQVMELVKSKTINWRHIKKLKALTSQSDECISTWLGINVKTLRSYRDLNKQISGSIIEHIVLLLSLFRHGVEVFGSKEDFDAWLTEENFFFDGNSPTTYLSMISGIRFIDSRLTAMEYGDNV